MKAVTWHGQSDIRVENVPDPKIEDPGDIIIQITSIDAQTVMLWHSHEQGIDLQDGSDTRPAL